jgi:hypothetical protein
MQVSAKEIAAELIKQTGQQIELKQLEEAKHDRSWALPFIYRLVRSTARPGAPFKELYPEVMRIYNGGELVTV